MFDWAKVDMAMRPERVKNVPKMVRKNVAEQRDVPHLEHAAALWIIMEWTKAVPQSHGKNAAFSTGSQAQ
jgi:hypothetical protein